MIGQPKLLTKAQVNFYRGLKRSKNRKNEALFLLEGIKLCEELFKSQFEIEACIISKGFDKLALPEQIIPFVASPTQIQQISDSKTPQGIICVSKIPGPALLPLPTSGKTLLVLDGMADPGNMGTIFRSALWFGIDDILLGPDCVDAYSPKVVRSSMGAILSLNIHHSEDLKASALTWQQAGGELTALHMSGTALEDFQTEKGLFLVVGSESHGVHPDLLQLTTALAIEKRGGGESLNAAIAAGIALYALTEQ
ncbi:RNA methyltransferase [bacterium]|nr:RNA methyltransferase [bacterium]